MALRRGTVPALVLAAVVVACACLAPLHQRAMLQAYGADRVGELSPLQSGVRVRSQSTTQDASGLTVTIPVDDALLAEQVPAPIRARMQPPLTTIENQVSAAGRGRTAVGPLLWRTGQCEHVRMVQGTCPAGPRAPRVLLADEPTSDLDAVNRNRVLEALRTCARGGGLVVMATHDPEAAAQADAELALDEGVATWVRRPPAG